MKDFFTSEFIAHCNLNRDSSVYRFTLDHQTQEIDFSKISRFTEADIMQDIEIAKRRVLVRSTHIVPMCGDVVRYANGKEFILSVIYPDGRTQVSECGSRHMGQGGHSSHSGGFINRDPGTKIQDMEYMNESKEILFWFFSNNHSGAHRGIYFNCPVKVWYSEDEADNIEYKDFIIK